MGRGEPPDRKRRPARRSGGRTQCSCSPAARCSCCFFLLVFDSLAGFMLYTRLLATAPAPSVSTDAYITPLVGAVMGATVLDEPLWLGAFLGAPLVFGAVALERRGRGGAAVR